MSLNWGIDKVNFVHLHDVILAIFKNEIEKFEDKWVKPEKIIWIVVTQIQKDKQGIYSL